MAGFDINKIIAEYSDDDFGFSAVSEEDYILAAQIRDEINK